MLETLFAEVQDHDRQFTVYGRDEEMDIETQFAPCRVTVIERDLPPHGPDPFVVIEEDGEFAGAISLSEVRELLTPPFTRPDEHIKDDISLGYRILFAVLDETVFTAMDRGQLLAVSREIEERAFRVGAGTLRVSFQTLSTFASQVDIYRHLATETDLDIHIYCEADRTPPAIPGITYHDYATDSHSQYWVLAFDGGPDTSHPCGLVAREDHDTYAGFWTDDTALVSDIGAALTAHRNRSFPSDRE